LKNSKLYNFLSQLKLEEKVVFRNKDSKSYNIDFHKDVKKRIESIRPDAVYIFNSQPLILFFDLTELERDLDELYKKVWSFDNTSIIFIIREKDIEVFNALNYDKKLKSLEPIDKSLNEIKRLFNLWQLESGETWKWFQKDYIDKKSRRNYQRRVNERLFSNIKQVREKLKEKNLTETEANSLILRLIFIRYLIDRKIKIDDKLISGAVGNLNERRKSFIQLIKQPKKLNELFKILNDRFNGVLFKENEITLTSSQAEYLSGVFAGELEGEDSIFKDFFFEIFDFSIIPVEVISGIYESLIDEEKRKLDSAVYTPSFLVDYILNDTVDEFLKDHNPKDCTVFEVAVGSGIFLVQSLRRIIEKEIELNGKTDNQGFADLIKGFAENNLYGIDINPQALKVACFSIYVALLDYLEPADINVYQFPELINKNLFEANFFDTNHQFNKVINNIKPKFILGNPPWKKDKSKEHLSWVNSTKTYNKKITGGLEIAQSFLLRTKDFMHDNAICSLIVTSTIFYNVSTTTKEFKLDFLTSFNLQKFFDLSPVRRLIFEKKNSPATVVTYSLSKSKDFNKNIVKHQSVKSNVFLKNLKILVIEKFDQKEILQKLFIENDWMFKVALYGNTLDFYFLKRLDNESEFKIIDFIDNKTKFKGAGIERGDSGKSYPELIGIKIIENDALLPEYLGTDGLDTLNTNDVILSRRRNLNLFFNSKILIREQNHNETKPFISFVEDKPLVYRKGVFAISSSSDNFLYQLYAELKSDYFEYLLFILSASWGIGTRPAIRFEDLLNINYIEGNENQKNLLIKYAKEYIKKAKEFYANYFRKTSIHFQLKPSNIKELEPPIHKNALEKINTIVNDIYEVKEHEKDLIDYVLNVSRYQFQESKQDLFTKRVDGEKEYLIKYAEVYLQEFSDIYTDEFIQVEIFSLEHFIAMNFVMKQEQPKETVIYSKNKDAGSVLKTLADTLSISEIVSTSDPTKNLFIQKDIKGFEENSFYVIKPNEYKCWHRAMAWYDVAEFKEAIQKAEIDELNASIE
jgi:hypothetical protein